jgi:hypothetical protein
MATNRARSEWERILAAVKDAKEKRPLPSAWIWSVAVRELEKDYLPDAELRAEMVEVFDEELAESVSRSELRLAAKLVEVTKIGNLYTEGAMRTARAVQDMGLEVEKKWVTMGDDLVSDGCNANAAVGWIPLNDLFPSGHMQPLRFPGCRCDVYHRGAKR